MVRIIAARRVPKCTGYPMVCNQWNTAEMDASGGRSHCFTISKGNKESYSEHLTWNDAEDDVMQVTILGICSECIKSKHTINSETGQDNCLLEMTTLHWSEGHGRNEFDCLGNRSIPYDMGSFSQVHHLSYSTTGIPKNSPRISGV